MRDLIDIHRENIAKAGVVLAEAIAAATGEYSAAVAASEAALEVAMEKRIAAFNGAEKPIEAKAVETETPKKAPRLDVGYALGQAQAAE